MANCDETIAKLYEYLDRELSPAERREVEGHLALCPPCREHFRFEYNVLSLIGKRCRETAAPPELVARVRKMCERAPSDP
ncbi:MAG: mycothiol system anti-sigma-R factor [Chloroflexi bacterium]|nr:MAG: mycothiol system anti-sigma-R factor [Chloroflexota bacterium]